MPNKNMKIEKTSHPIWTNSIEIISNEECLPVIGSNQVSSILSNLDTSQDVIPDNVGLILLPNVEYKLPVLENPINIQSNLIIVEDGNSTAKTPLKEVKQENYGNILYFVCNICPYLCTEDSKITEHVESAHKNKPVKELVQLKCPACGNIFFHKISLRSHLVHDHAVCNTDLNIILQSIIFYANQSKSQSPKNNVKVVEKKEEETLVEVNDDSNGVDEYSPIVENTEEKNLTDHTVQKIKADQKLKIHELKIVNIPLNPIQPRISKKIQVDKPATDLKLLDLKKIYKCDIPDCKVRFQDKIKLQYHMQSHFQEGFRCIECGNTCASFLCWKTLSSHLWRHHKVNMELYACNKCEYKTHSLANLNNIHKLIHSEVKAFSCTECDKSFKNVKQLRNHKVIHKIKSSGKQWLCEICSKCFGEKRFLKKHMMIHSKNKPYLCSYCGYKGTTKGAVKMHMRQHTGEKPFACDTCQYTTSDHNSLRRHKLRHSGQKPYKCTYCSYACIQSSTYKVHLKTKHPGLEKHLMYSCSECQYKSVNKERFTAHFNIAHKLQKTQINQNKLTLF